MVSIAFRNFRLLAPLKNKHHRPHRKFIIPKFKDVCLPNGCQPEATPRVEGPERTRWIAPQTVPRRYKKTAQYFGIYVEDYHESAHPLQKMDSYRGAFSQGSKQPSADILKASSNRHTPKFVQIVPHQAPGEITKSYRDKLSKQMCVTPATG